MGLPPLDASRRARRKGPAFRKWSAVYGRGDLIAGGPRQGVTRDRAENMMDIETGVISPKASLPLRAPCLAPAAAFIAIAFLASACSMVDQLNPFGPEKYK